MTAKQSLIVFIGLGLVWLNIRAGGFRFPSGAAPSAGAATPGSAGQSGFGTGGQAGGGANGSGGGGSW